MVKKCMKKEFKRKACIKDTSIAVNWPIKGKVIFPEQLFFEIISI